MNKLFRNLAVGFLFFVSVVTTTARAADSAAPREYIEWCDIWISHANETNLPRVLLIGDSITRDYYPGVEQRLNGRAYVGRLASSAFLTDPALLQELDLVLSQYHFSVVHFNNGMHGWPHSEAEYERAFPRFLQAIHRGAPRAKLIWASTTPIRSDPEHPDGTQATGDRIDRRNAIALKCLHGKNVAVDDLNATMRGHPEYHSDNVHFNNTGVDIQAAQVAVQVAAALPKSTNR